MKCPLNLVVTPLETAKSELIYFIAGCAGRNAVQGLNVVQIICLASVSVHYLRKYIKFYYICSEERPRDRRHPSRDRLG